MIGAAGLGAQNLPGNIWSSPQSATTEGRYRSNADNYIRPDYYTNVNFDKVFGMTAFLWDDTFNAVTTLGFATYAKKVYIGAFYNGNMWKNKPVNHYFEQALNPAPLGGIAGNSYRVYNSIGVGGSTNPVNNAALLIGAADMGFRLSYRSDYQSFNKSGIVNAGQLYNNYRLERGYIAPQIAWAMAKNLNKNGIRPYAAIDLVFNRDYQNTETTGADSAGNTGQLIGHSLNHFDPAFTAGLGGYTFYNKNNFDTSFDFDYELIFNIYNNEYSFVDSGVYKTNKIRGTYSPGSNPYVEKFFVSNLLIPSVAGSFNMNRIVLRFKLNLPLTVSNEKQDSMVLDSGSGLLYYRETNSSITFSFQPDLRLALQYKIIPERLTLNAGARIQATAISLETVDQKTYSASGEEARKINQDSFNGDFVSRFHIGLNYNFTENIWIEAATGVTSSFGSGAIELFAQGGLFSFGSILAVFKF